MSAESAHLSTFGAETETEAEIRSTSITSTDTIRTYTTVYTHVVTSLTTPQFTTVRCNHIDTG